MQSDVFTPENLIENINLQNATEKGSVTKLEALIAKNPNINLNQKFTDNLNVLWGWGAIHVATSNNDTNFIKALIEKGANVDLTDKEKNTALHMASQNGNIDIVTALLKAQAHPNLTNLLGETPLQNVANKRIHHTDDFIIGKLLLENGADLEKINKRSELYPLLELINKLSYKEITVINNHHKILKKLSDTEIDVMAENIIGMIEGGENLNTVYKGSKYYPLKEIIEKLPKDELGTIFSHYSILKKLSDAENKTISLHFSNFPKNDAFEANADYFKKISLPRSILRVSRVDAAREGPDPQGSHQR